MSRRDLSRRLILRAVMISQDWLPSAGLQIRSDKLSIRQSFNVVRHPRQRVDLSRSRDCGTRWLGGTFRRRPGKAIRRFPSRHLIGKTSLVVRQKIVRGNRVIRGRSVVSRVAAQYTHVDHGACRLVKPRQLPHERPAELSALSGADPIRTHLGWFDLALRTLSLDERGSDR